MHLDTADSPCPLVSSDNTYRGISSVNVTTPVISRTPIYVAIVQLEDDFGTWVDASLSLDDVRASLVEFYNDQLGGDGDDLTTAMTDDEICEAIGESFNAQVIIRQV